MSKKILIVGSNYYNDIYLNLLKGALATVKSAEYKYQIRETSGSFEIPYLINRHINDKQFSIRVEFTKTIRN